MTRPMIVLSALRETKLRRLNPVRFALKRKICRSSANENERVGRQGDTTHIWQAKKTAATIFCITRLNTPAPSAAAIRAATNEADDEMISIRATLLNSDALSSNPCWA